MHLSHNNIIKHICSCSFLTFISFHFISFHSTTPTTMMTIFHLQYSTHSFHWFQFPPLERCCSYVKILNMLAFITYYVRFTSDENTHNKLMSFIVNIISSRLSTLSRWQDERKIESHHQQQLRSIKHVSLLLSSVLCDSKHKKNVQKAGNIREMLKFWMASYFIASRKVQ